MCTASIYNMCGWDCLSASVIVGRRKKPNQDGSERQGRDQMLTKGVHEDMKSAKKPAHARCDVGKRFVIYVAAVPNAPN